MRSFHVFAAIASTALLAACKGDLEPTQAVFCPTLAQAAGPIRVEIRDAATGAPLAAGSLALARSGAFVDTLRLAVFSAGTRDTMQVAERWSGYLRFGTYTVTVERAGYRPWSASSVPLVRTLRASCDVQIVHLTALLTAA